MFLDLKTKQAELELLDLKLLKLARAQEDFDRVMVQRQRLEDNRQTAVRNFEGLAAPVSTGRYRAASPPERALDINQAYISGSVFVIVFLLMIFALLVRKRAQGL